MDPVLARASWHHPLASFCHMQQQSLESWGKIYTVVYKTKIAMVWIWLLSHNCNSFTGWKTGSLVYDCSNFNLSFHSYRKFLTTNLWLYELLLLLSFILQNSTARYQLLFHLKPDRLRMAVLLLVKQSVQSFHRNYLYQ